jgi:hypothetical protein
MAVVWGSPQEIRWRLPAASVRLARSRVIRAWILALLLASALAYELF